MKARVSFVCQECGYDSPKFLGKCPECGQWNSFREIKISNAKSQSSSLTGNGPDNQKLQPKNLSQINSTRHPRLPTGFLEMDTVLGGGIVPGSVTLLAGDPGVGKSTLLLQLALNLSDKSNKPHESSILYVSGEESEEQIKLRAQRLWEASPENFLLVSTGNTDKAIEIISFAKPKLVIVDSIQTFSSENAGGLSGSVGQVRYAALEFIKVAKSLSIPIILVGHVTKEGMVAGPMVLSHMVDAVLFLEGEKSLATRILRSFKNRFGPVDEVGIFTMAERGMVEAKDPQSLFLNQNPKDVAGSVLVSTLEGTRAFLVEIQALVLFSKMPFPRRVSLGINPQKLELLLAVLQKQCALRFETMDVFVNVAGGLKLSDPAIDIGICLALFSSLKNTPMPKAVGIAEVGLLGELRTVSMVEKRIAQAKKLGFTNIISAKSHKSIREVIQGV